MRAPACTCPFNGNGHYEQCPFMQWLHENPLEMEAWKERVAKSEADRTKNETPAEAWDRYMSQHDMGPYSGR
jgi:hypothetical protein